MADSEDWLMRAAASAFEQASSLLLSVEGPEMRFTTMNAAARAFIEPTGSTIGSSILENSVFTATGIMEELHRVYEQAVSYTAKGWRFSVPDDAGVLSDIYLDFVYTPWLAEDGSVRGVNASAVDVTASTLQRLAAEADSQVWQGRFRSSQAALHAVQSALLPAAVPVLPRLAVAARYLLADQDTAAGGDWFSVLPLEAGRVALVVGDVVGHGVVASATMGQLRAVLDEHLCRTGDVTASLAALEVFAGRVPAAAAATVCVAVVDTAAGSVQYCTAGHPPPLMVDGEQWAYLKPTGAAALGSGHGFPTESVDLPQGAVLLLYTDGLVERPGRSWAQSTVEIGQVVANAVAGQPPMTGGSDFLPERVCETVVELLTRRSGFTDDITVLAAHNSPPPPLSLAVTATADPATVTVAARRIDRWLAECHASPMDRRQIGHAVVELVSNSVEHAFLNAVTPGSVDVRGRLSEDGVIELTVADRGSWRHPAAADGPGSGGRPLRGLGLPMASQMVDEVELSHADQGTTARIRHRLSRPSQIYRTPAARPAAPADLQELDMYIPVDTGGAMLVAGPVLLGTVQEFTAGLNLHTQGGTRSVTVDLNAVTHLASVGVRVLQQAIMNGARTGADVTVIAAPGSVAHQVLDIAGLDHLATSDVQTDPAGL